MKLEHNKCKKIKPFSKKNLKLKKLIRELETFDDFNDDIDLVTENSDTIMDYLEQNAHNIHTFLSFPKDRYLLTEWLRGIQKEDFIPDQESAVCSDHFTPDSFLINGSSDKRRRVLPGAIPSIVHPPSHYGPVSSTPKKRGRGRPPKKQQGFQGVEEFINDSPRPSSQPSAVVRTPSMADLERQRRKHAHGTDYDSSDSTSDSSEDALQIDLTSPSDNRAEEAPNQWVICRDPPNEPYPCSIPTLKVRKEKPQPENFQPNNYPTYNTPTNFYNPTLTEPPFNPPDLIPENTLSKPPPEGGLTLEEEMQISNVITLNQDEQENMETSTFEGFEAVYLEQMLQPTPQEEQQKSAEAPAVVEQSNGQAGGQVNNPPLAALQEMTEGIPPPPPLRPPQVNQEMCEEEATPRYENSSIQKPRKEEFDDFLEGDMKFQDLAQMFWQVAQKVVTEKDIQIVNFQIADAQKQLKIQQLEQILLSYRAQFPIYNNSSPYNVCTIPGCKCINSVPSPLPINDNELRKRIPPKKDRKPYSVRAPKSMVPNSMMSPGMVPNVTVNRYNFPNQMVPRNSPSQMLPGYNFPNPRLPFPRTSLPNSMLPGFNLPNQMIPRSSSPMVPNLMVPRNQSPMVPDYNIPKPIPRNSLSPQMGMYPNSMYQTQNSRPQNYQTQNSLPINSNFENSMALTPKLPPNSHPLPMPSPQLPVNSECDDITRKAKVTATASIPNGEYIDIRNSNKNSPNLENKDKNNLSGGSVSLNNSNMYPLWPYSNYQYPYNSQYNPNPQYQPQYPTYPQNPQYPNYFNQYPNSAHNKVLSQGKENQGNEKEIQGPQGSPQNETNQGYNPPTSE